MMQKQYRWLHGEHSFLSLIAVTDGQQGYIAFAKAANVPFKIIDNAHEIKAEFHNECFYINDSKFQYNQLVDYKNIPDVLNYLKQQNL